MGNLTADFHWHDREIGDTGPTIVSAHIRRSYAVIKLGERDRPESLTLYLPNAAAAYALASAVMTCGEQLEKQEQAAKGDPEAPWVDVPLPLDDAQVLDVERQPATTVATLEDAWPPAVRFDLEEPPSICLRGTALECAEVGCADEGCARF